MKRNNKMEEREERQGSNRGAEEERNERMNTGFKKFKRWNGERDEVGKKKRKVNSIGWEVINGMKREGKRRKRKNS